MDQSGVALEQQLLHVKMESEEPLVDSTQHRRPQRSVRCALAAAAASAIFVTLVGVAALNRRSAGAGPSITAGGAGPSAALMQAQDVAASVQADDATSQAQNRAPALKEQAKEQSSTLKKQAKEQANDGIDSSEKSVADQVDSAKIAEDQASSALLPAKGMVKKADSALASAKDTVGEVMYNKRVDRLIDVLQSLKGSAKEAADAYAGKGKAKEVGADVEGHDATPAHRNSIIVTGTSGTTLYVGNGLYHHRADDVWEKLDGSMIIRRGDGGWNFCVASEGVVPGPCYGTHGRQGYVGNVDNMPRAGSVYTWNPKHSITLAYGEI